MSPLFLCFTLLLPLYISGFGAEDSTLNIQQKCGEAYTITMTHDSMERQLSMYIPKIFCDEDLFAKAVNKRLANTDNPFDPKTHQMTIPMLLAIHCLGCTAKRALSKWQSYAEQHTFILIAPQGMESAWNADQCCDPAVQNGIDDIGFIQTIINGAQTSFPSIFPFATVGNKNHDGYVWLTGFSNGAFMADKIAWASAINQFSKIVAAAPMAGYIYDHKKYIDNALKNGAAPNKIAMFFHHSKTDQMVDPNGCCMDSPQRCCCDIAQKSVQCLSVYEEFGNWLRWNNCNGDVTYEALKTDTDKLMDISCAYATPQQHGCDTFTYLCMYGSTSHVSWGTAAPQSEQVMTFFLKALCLQQHGQFDETLGQCECARDSMFAGSHCITPKSALGMAGYAETGTGADNIDDDAQIVQVVGGKMEDMQDNNGQMVGNEANGDGKSERWKAVLRNGKQREMKHNKELSVLGAASNKYSDKTFEVGVGADGVSNWGKIPNIAIVVICGMVFVAIALFVMYRKKQNGYKYSKVQLYDNEPVNGTLLINH